MLEEIRIRGLGVISDAVLELGPGADRGDRRDRRRQDHGGDRAGVAVRRPGRLVPAASRSGLGQRRGQVAGRRAARPTAQAVTEAGGDLDADGSLVLRRVITAAGRSRAVAGGASVPATVLARLAENLVAVHGQSDQQRLTQPAEQRLTLDRFAGLDLADCRAAFAAVAGRGGRAGPPHRRRPRVGPRGRTAPARPRRDRQGRAAAGGGRRAGRPGRPAGACRRAADRGPHRARRAARRPGRPGRRRAGRPVA